jgi:hypothetical protein
VALWALAFYAETIGPAVLCLNVAEVWVGRIAELCATDAGETGCFELLGHPLVVPHPEVAGAPEESRGHGLETTGYVLLTQEAVLHETRGGAWTGIGEVGPGQLLKVRNDQPEGATGAKITEDVSEGDAKLVEGHVFEHVGAIDRLCGLQLDWQTFNDVAVFNIFRVVRKAPFFQERGDKRHSALEPEGWAGIEVLPIIRGAQAASKLNVPMIHKSILYRA